MKNSSSFLFATVLFSLSFLPAFGQMKINEAKLGKDVQNRVVTEEATSFALQSKVFVWVKTSGGTGELTANWKNGNHSHTSTLTIGGDPWRTWAYMTAYSAGQWTVSITDDKGTVLKEMTFTVQ